MKKKHEHSFSLVSDKNRRVNFIDEMSEMFNIEKEHLKEFEGVKEIIQIKVYQCECGEEYETHDIVRGKKLKKERKK